MLPFCTPLYPHVYLVFVHHWFIIVYFIRLISVTPFPTPVYIL